MNKIYLSAYTVFVNQAVYRFIIIEVIPEIANCEFRINHEVLLCIYAIKSLHI